MRDTFLGNHTRPACILCPFSPEGDPQRHQAEQASFKDKAS